MMPERLVLVACPALVPLDADGRALGGLVRVVAALEAFCPWIDVVGPGICALPARGPARYFGGEEPFVTLVRDRLCGLGCGEIEVGIAEGVFAARLAAHAGVVVAAGATPEFLAPFPLEVLGRAELRGVLVRIGIRTLGAFAALPSGDVLGRFGADGARCHRVARGEEGELPGLRDPRTASQVSLLRHPPPAGPAQPGFWGATQGRERRARAALVRVQGLLGAEAVEQLHRREARSPRSQGFRTLWSASDAAPVPERGERGPWPGQLPPPAPVVVYRQAREVGLLDPGEEPVIVSARGLLSAPPAVLSLDAGRREQIAAWSAPWPLEERWWSSRRRRAARLQVLTAEGAAHLLSAERGHWWLEATYG
jgi:hypothetical protein